MGYLSGTSGYVKVGGNQFSFDKWKCDIKTNAPKVTNYTTSGFQKVIPGVVGGVITANGPYNQGAFAIAINTTYTFLLGMDTGIEISVSALVTGITIDSSVEDSPRVTVTAESTASFTAALT